MKKLIVLAAVALALGGCARARDTRLVEGAVIGGAGGAIIGGVATGTAGGTVVGGVVGAAAGALVADVTRPRRGGSSCYFSNRLGHRVCRYR